MCPYCPCYHSSCQCSSNSLQAPFAAVDVTTTAASLGIPTDSDEYRRDMRVRSKRASMFLQRPTTLPNLIISTHFIYEIEQILPGPYSNQSGCFQVSCILSFDFDLIFQKLLAGRSEQVDPILRFILGTICLTGRERSFGCRTMQLLCLRWCSHLQTGTSHESKV